MPELVKVYLQKQTRYPEINEFPQDFDLVAVLSDCPCGSWAENAWQITQHNTDGGSWLSKPGVRPLVKACRSMMVGDVFVAYGGKGCTKQREAVRALRVGFKPLDEVTSEDL